MNFVSTRGRAEPAALSQALSAGLAPDGGLYVPEALPAMDGDTLRSARTLPELARRLLRPFFAGDLLAPALDAIVEAAFDFPCPLVPLADRAGASAVLELFHGPTAAFKDFGARFLAECLARIPGPPMRTVLVATSGDTGGAVAAAFWRRAGVRVVILYPDGKVSERQAHQLCSFGDNVQAFAVQGSFDDCQALAKQALSDPALVQRLGLTSANSISLGRLLPQAVYHAWAAACFAREYDCAPGLLVPTGNLGNALAAILARSCGLPLGDVVLCVNANRTLVDFLADSFARPRAAIPTIANAMDVAAPSNLERLRWWFPRHAELVRGIGAEARDDAAIRAALLEAHARYGYLACPHTATALGALMARRDAGDASPWIAVSTAHPAKFEQVVEPLVGHAIEVPRALQEMLARPAQRQSIAAEYAAFKRVLASDAPM